ncbi:hypothetical protein T05_1639 [Trichinella murrelli]|uniref:Uncharacterized protein n=1 Tax=Trichinella murrelli TaxID=144512 RepID=A0A0V0U5L4_9BILA|nr:hypothetical protein T05_1639 [Trichinella murrelli]
MKFFKLSGTPKTDLKYQSVDFCFLKARLLGKLCTKLEERQADVVKNRPAGRFQLTMSCTAAS